MRYSTMLLVIALGLGRVALGDEMPDSSADSSSGSSSGLRDGPAFNDTHPVYSTDSHWAEDIIVAVGGLILAAAVIGPIVRAEVPQAVPAAMSHEEDPAADRHTSSQ